MNSKISVGTAFAEAAAFLRAEKKLLAPVGLALLVVPVTITGLVQPARPFEGTPAIEPWMLVVLVAMLTQLVGVMAVSRLAMGWSGPVGSAIMLALRRLPAALGALLLFFAGLSLVLVPLIVVTIVASGGAEPTAASARLANSLTLMAMLVAGPRLLLAPTIAVAEAIGPVGLVKRSWTLSKGQALRLLGFFLLFLVASLILGFAVAAVIGSLSTLAFGPSQPFSVSRLLPALAGGLVQGAAATLYAAMVGRILVQLKPDSTSGM